MRVNCATNLEALRKLDGLSLRGHHASWYVVHINHPESKGRFHLCYGAIETYSYEDAVQIAEIMEANIADCIITIECYSGVPDLDRAAVVSMDYTMERN